MGQMIDAVDPANIPAGYDGAPVLRITVLGDPAGQAFDIEQGNPSAAAQVPGVVTRYRAGKWSIVYVNWSLEGSVTDQLHAYGLEWAPANLWPARGVYLWATDPSGNIARGAWRPATAPLAVQNRFLGAYDLSDTYGAFPARVAGYIDGVRSRWPSAAWGRFRQIPDVMASPGSGARPPQSSAGGPAIHLERDRMYLANDGQTQFTVSVDSNGARVKQGIGTLADADHPELQQLAAVLGNLGTCPTFLSECRTVG